VRVSVIITTGIQFKFELFFNLYSAKILVFVSKAIRLLYFSHNLLKFIEKELNQGADKYGMNKKIK
jgi:hypothetical protein